MLAVFWHSQPCLWGCPVCATWKLVTILLHFKFSLTTVIDLLRVSWGASLKFELVTGSQADRKVPAGMAAASEHRHTLLWSACLAFTFSSPAGVNPIWLHQVMFSTCVSAARPAHWREEEQTSLRWSCCSSHPSNLYNYCRKSRSMQTEVQQEMQRGFFCLSVRGVCVLLSSLWVVI